jgi:N-acetylglucosaminyldiphosphoundecaprenol N-acetyl-beta-D-mannosaminyltransferase
VAAPFVSAAADLFGTRIDALTLAEATELCARAAREGHGLLVGVVNAAKLVHLQSDAELRASIEAADIVLADGMAVVWASRLLGQPLPERVTGIDLLESLMAQAERDGLSVYFLGGKAEVLDGMLAVLRARYPNLGITGWRDGYFSAQDEAGLVRAIQASGARLLFVGMPTPKKEIFLRVWRRELSNLVCHGVGGSFDVLGGVVRRAPLAWQRLGLEWLYRLLQEPRRMWRRYLVTNTIFLGMVARAWVARIAGRI